MESCSTFGVVDELGGGAGDRFSNFRARADWEKCSTNLKLQHIDGAEQGDLLRCVVRLNRSAVKPTDNSRIPRLILDSNLGEHGFQASSRPSAQAQRHGQAEPEKKSPAAVSLRDEKKRG